MIVKTKQIIIPLTVLILAIIIIYSLIPNFHPFGGLKIANSEQAILNQSKKYLNKANVPYDEQKLRIVFENDKNFVRWINSEYKIDEANKILSDAGSAYYWTVSQAKNDDDKVVVSSNSETNINLNKSSFRLKILDSGKIIEFSTELADSIVKISLTPDEAKNTCTEFHSKTSE